MVAHVAMILLFVGTASATFVATEVSPLACDPRTSEEPCCPIPYVYISDNYDDWRACIPADRLPIEGDYA